MLSEKQSGVLRGMLAGLAVALVALAGAIVTAPTALLPAGQDRSSAIAHALASDVLLVACLAASIGRLASHRFFTPADIDGGGVAHNTDSAQVLQAILQNTLEQTVLGVAVHLAWAATMPHTWQGAVPTAALLFVVGRVLFWRGYAGGAPARALGFALTFYPSVVMLLLVGGHLLTGDP